MNFEEFVKKYKGKATDYDGGCGVQCVDLAKLYIDKVLGIKPQSIGNAEAYWNRYNELSYLKNNFDRIANTPSFVPQKGDVVVWGKKHGKYGHIAIADGVGNTSYFYSYDQNWGGKGQGMTRIRHTYKSGFVGVLRPKNQAKIYDPNYKVGQAVEVHIPVGIAFTEGDRCLVDDGKNQFWIHKSVIKDGKIIARAIVCFAQGDNYIVQVFDDQFWCEEKNIAKALN